MTIVVEADDNAVELTEPNGRLRRLILSTGWIGPAMAGYLWGDSTVVIVMFAFAAACWLAICDQVVRIAPRQGSLNLGLAHPLWRHTTRQEPIAEVSGLQLNSDGGGYSSTVLKMRSGETVQIAAGPLDPAQRAMVEKALGLRKG